MDCIRTGKGKSRATFGTTATMKDRLQGIKTDQKCIKQNQAALSFLSPCLIFETGNGWLQEPI